MMSGSVSRLKHLVGGYMNIGNILIAQRELEMLCISSQKVIFRRRKEKKQREVLFREAILERPAQVAAS